MKLSWAVKLVWVASASFLFALFGVALGAIAFSLGIVFMGDQTKLGEAVLIFGSIAAWPYVFLHLILPHNLFDRLSDAQFPIFVPIGWSLFGIPVGLWRAKRELTRINGNQACL